MKLIIVNSHERSGTHFLMNSLALNFGYVSSPYVNFDYPDMTPYAPENILRLLQRLHKPHFIVKSHYDANFFRSIMGEIQKFAHVFYIYREEDGVFKSCLKHWNDIQWQEAPKCENIEELKVAPPSGGVLRYQMKQHPSMLARWQHHKASWMYSMAGFNIIYVRYEDLENRFDKTMRIISKRIEMPVIGGIARKPDRKNTVQDGQFQEQEVIG